MSIYVGLDLGATFLKYGYGNSELGLQKLTKRSIDTSVSRAALLEALVDSTNELIEPLRNNHTLKGITLGTPGSVNPVTGEVLGSTPNIENWGGVNPKTVLEDTFQCPIYIENDANLMAYGEAQSAELRGKSILGVTIGTGIGGGLIINNDIFRGSNYSALELGHTIVVSNGRLCACGKHGCVEAYSSAKSIMYDILHAHVHPCGVELEIALSEVKTNPTVARIFYEAYDKLGLAIANSVTLLDPEVIIIGGGITECTNFDLTPLKTAIFRYLTPEQKESLEIKTAALRNSAAVWGGILLAECSA
ncbi:MAG: ROK family protein [Candidatus Cloacimonas sp.]|nr:ROK family protein [Candidatus Cloacimonadota bacterium]